MNQRKTFEIVNVKVNVNEKVKCKCKISRKMKRQGFYGRSKNISAKKIFTTTNSTPSLSPWGCKK